MKEKFAQYCSYVVSKYGNPEDIGAEVLAEEFVKTFEVSSLPKLNEIIDLVKREIGSVAPVALPKGLSANHSYKRDQLPSIQYDVNSWVGRNEHSLFHEVGEIIDEHFERIYAGYKRHRDRIGCRKADKFAAAVLMQKEVFLPMVLNTGLDMIFLRNYFCRAYSAIPRRATELLPKGPDFLVAIYGKSGKNSKHPGEFRVFDSVRSKGMKLGYRTIPRKPPRCSGHVWPARGDKPFVGSLVEKVIKEGRAYYLEHVDGFDLWNYNDLSVILRPVKGRYGQTYKVILVAIRFSDRAYLKPQLDLVKPIVKTKSYQFI